MMRNEEAIMHQYLREQGVIFKSPMHRRMVLKTCAILRDDTLVDAKELTAYQELYRSALLGGGDDVEKRAEVEALVDWVLDDNGVTMSMEVGALNKNAKDKAPEDGKVPTLPAGMISRLMQRCEKNTKPGGATLSSLTSRLNGYLSAQFRSDPLFVKCILVVALHWIDGAAADDVGGHAQSAAAGISDGTGGVVVKAEEIARERYNYVVTAQVLGNMKEQATDYFKDVQGTGALGTDIPCLTAARSKRDKMNKDCHSFMCIRDLMRRYPSLRVAYVQKYWINGGAAHYSYLTKYSTPVETYIDENAQEEKCDFGQKATYLNEVRRVKLPGHFMVGEAKAQNQNHAIIFTRGESLQAIDMNQVSRLCVAVCTPYTPTSTLVPVPHAPPPPQCAPLTLRSLCATPLSPRPIGPHP
jgi:hypothetical protein